MKKELLSIAPIAILRQSLRLCVELSFFFRKIFGVAELNAV